MVEQGESGWHSEQTAYAYEEYAQAYSMYKATAADLVAIADITPGMTVIDLACGTGIVTGTILEQLGNTGQIIGVDMSEAMLAIARRKIDAANVRLVRSAAECVHEAVTAEADVAVCNSAFWQMRIGATVTSLSNTLKDDGRFVFNLPQGFFFGTGEMSPPPVSSPTLIQLILEIATTEYGYIPRAPVRWRGPLDFATLECIMETCGFIITSHRTITYHKPAEETLAFFKIPIMLESRFPGLPVAARMAALEKAWQRYEKRDTTGDWTYFITKKRAPAV